MGVYINMEMPTNCEECPLGDSLHCQVLPSVPALWAEYTNAIREKRMHSECPLIPVPPHGRLIDADQFHKYNKEYWGRDFNHPQYEDTLADLVNAAPTVIPASEDGEVL